MTKASGEGREPRGRAAASLAVLPPFRGRRPVRLGPRRVCRGFFGFARLGAQPCGRKQVRGHLNSNHASLLNTSAFKSIFVQSPVRWRLQLPAECIPRAPSGSPAGPGKSHSRGGRLPGPNHLLRSPRSFPEPEPAVQGSREARGEGARPLWGVCVGGWTTPGFSLLAMARVLQVRVCFAKQDPWTDPQETRSQARLGL